MVPAVDLLGDEAVRLEQGDFDRVAVRANPEAAGAAASRLRGRDSFTSVDLDGAREGGIRADLIASLAKTVAPTKVQVSGGIRSPTDARTAPDRRRCAGRRRHRCLN